LGRDADLEGSWAGLMRPLFPRKPQHPGPKGIDIALEGYQIRIRIQLQMQRQFVLAVRRSSVHPQQNGSLKRIALLDSGDAGDIDVDAWLEQAGSQLVFIARGSHLAALREDDLRIDRSHQPSIH